MDGSLRSSCNPNLRFRRYGSCLRDITIVLCPAIAIHIPSPSPSRCRSLLRGSLHHAVAIIVIPPNLESGLQNLQPLSQLPGYCVSSQAPLFAPRSLVFSSHLPRNTADITSPQYPWSSDDIGRSTRDGCTSIDRESHAVFCFILHGVPEATIECPYFYCLMESFFSVPLFCTFFPLH